MPTTEYDDEIIASMPPGTRVVHARGRGVVTSDPIEYGQIPVRFDGLGDFAYCYPTNLEHDAEEDGTA